MKRGLAVFVLFSASLVTASGPSQNQASTRSPHGELNLPCQSCHTSLSWKPLRAFPDFNHNATKYPLRGMHTSVACTGCHVKLVFTEVGHTCADCHADIHRGQMGAKCETCHSVRGWQVSIKDIQQHQNRFPLVGAHASLTCDSCHKGAASGQFVGLSTACISCHQADFAKTTNPNHTALGFSPDCQTCHTMDSWSGAQFDHAKTGFALTGAHSTVPCTQCHTGGRFAGTPTQCSGCHMADFQKTTNPNHVTSGLPTTCEQCHNTTSWGSANFDHSKTAFPLTGAHVTVQCAQCHAGNKYAGTPTQCSACHIADFQKTTNPNHVTGGFPQTCEQCHTTATWLTSTFNHNTQTKFALTGAHTGLACLQCHTSGAYSSTPTACYACHTKDYQGTTNPNHAAAAFPTDCSICHSTTNWLGANFDHSKTAFPLTGAHVGLTCSSCHSSGIYAGLPTTCVSCHLTNFQQTTNPNHTTSGFPTDCQVCHNTAAWIPSIFDHNKTVFPLTGAHIKVACSSCHVGGKYAGTPTDCYSCHKTEYQTVTNPNHVAAAFPTTCQTCHNTTAWTGATFNHTWFPIYSGTHQGKWTTCADCHANPADYSSFTCITCHTHNKTDTDAHHGGVRNYVYSGTACYSCHKS